MGMEARASEVTSHPTSLKVKGMVGGSSRVIPQPQGGFTGDKAGPPEPMVPFFLIPSKSNVTNGPKRCSKSVFDACKINR